MADKSRITLRVGEVLARRIADEAQRINISRAAVVKLALSEHFAAPRVEESK
jgi:hypothetical protein